MTRRRHNRTALVTGASGGVGLEIARALASDGARVLMPVRSRERGERAIDSIRRTVPDAALELRDLDLARMASVSALGAQLLAEAAPIDLFVMNAGVVLLGDRARHVTEDSHELHFQTNFLGHFALTSMMLPLLCAGGSGGARIAVQGSMASARARLDWDDLQLEKGYRPMRAYSASKLALALFGLELVRRSAADGWGLTVNLCHPGVSPGTGIAGELRAVLGPRLVNSVARHIGNPPATAALSALMALDAAAGSGRFYGPTRYFGLAGRPHELPLYPNLRDPADGLRVWQAAEKLFTSPAQ